jgi:hypothetical protein
MNPAEWEHRFWCGACGRGGVTPYPAGRDEHGCPWCGGTLTWDRPTAFPAPPALFGVGADEVLFCPACKRGGPAGLAPRRPDGVFQCPLCAGPLTPLLATPTPDGVFFPGMDDPAPDQPTEIRT